MVDLKCTAQQIGHCLGIARIRGDSKSTYGLGHDIGLMHQLGNRVVAAGNALCNKLGMNPWRAHMFAGLQSGWPVSAKSETFDVLYACLVAGFERHNIRWAKSATRDTWL
jgi:hypothetical protein